MSDQEFKIKQWCDLFIESCGPEFLDIFYKESDLKKRGDEQEEFLKSIYRLGFEDAFEVLSDETSFNDFIQFIGEKRALDDLQKKYDELLNEFTKNHLNLQDVLGLSVDKQKRLRWLNEVRESFNSIIEKHRG